MRYNKIRKMDISNGPGIRVSIFMQGCSFHCKDCFNSETWDFKAGKEFNDDVINKVLDLASLPHIVGLSILGGEPMHPNNREGTIKLAKAFKKRYPDKDIWVWSGYLFDELKDIDGLSYIDTLVDGRFVIEQANPTLKFRGSSNQRVIDVKKSLEAGNVVLRSEFI